MEKTNTEKINALKSHLEENFDLQDVQIPNEYRYTCLPLCLLDAIYSIGASYKSTKNTVERYAKYFGVTCYRETEDYLPEDKQHTIDELICNIGSNDADYENFAENIVKNKQRTSSQNGILKAEAVLQCAKVLQEAGIQRMQDFDEKWTPDLDEKFKKVKGQGSGISLSYFKMLCGNENELKPDRHVLRFLEKVLGHKVDKEEATVLIKGVAKELQKDCPNLTVRKLDYVIWHRMSSMA